MSRFSDKLAHSAGSFRIVAPDSGLELAEVQKRAAGLEAAEDHLILIPTDSAADVAGLLWAVDRVGGAALLAPAAAAVGSIGAELGSEPVPCEHFPGAYRLKRPPPGNGTEVLLMTSGTTGVRKIVRHSLEVLLARVRRAEPSSVWLLTYPPTAFAGLQVLLTALMNGATLVTAASMAPYDVLPVAAANGVTHISATPTFWRTWLLDAGAAERVPLQQITIGGEAVEQSTLSHLRSLYPAARLSHIYASTEAGALFSVSDGREGFPASWLETGVEGVELRIRDGVLEVRSARKMLGYASRTVAPMSGDGFLRTGDLVTQQGDRVLFCGRADRTINVAGYKVAPEEVERTLLAVEGVADTHVYGQRNVITGYVVAADVVCRPGFSAHTVIEAARQHAGAHLRKHQIPAQWRVVDRLRLNPAGKKERA